MRLARAIYPHYKERKIARQGQRIIPTLNLDESNAEDPYVCFRRRDVKSIRKTRRTDTTPAEKVARLRQELVRAKELANITVSREVKKLELNKDARGVLEARIKFIELKRKHPQFTLSTDDQLLIDPERVLAKRPKMTMEQNAVSLKIPRRSKDSTELNSPNSLSEDQVHPHERAELFAKEIERQCEMRKNSGWEDFLDLPTNLPISNHVFRALSLRASSSKASVGPTDRSPLSIRIRTGRGGRAFIDRRRFYARSGDPRNPPPDYPKHFPSISSDRSHTPKGWSIRIQPESDDEGSSLEAKDEYVRKINERWRYDDDSVVADEESRVLIDDFDSRYIPSRLSLFGDSELIGLSVDESHIRNAELYAISKQEPGQRALTAARHHLIAMKERMRQQAVTNAAAAGQAGAAPSQVASTSTPRPTLDPGGQIQNAALVVQPSGQLPTNAAAAQQLQPSGAVAAYNGQVHPHSAAMLQSVKRMGQIPMLAAQQRPGFNAIPGSQAPQVPVNGDQQQPRQQPSQHPQQQPPQTSVGPVPGQNQTQLSVNAPQPPASSFSNTPSLSPSTARPPTPSLTSTDTNLGSTQNGSPTRPPSQIPQQSPMIVPQITGMPFHSALPFNYAAHSQGAPHFAPVNAAPQQSQQPQTVAQQQLQQHFTREQLALVQHHAAMKNGINAVNGSHPYLNATSQQHAQHLSNGVPRNGMILPPSQGYPGLHATSNGPNGTSPMMNMPPGNMSLKMPPGRQPQWSRPGGPSQADVNGGAPNGNPTGSPIMQHHMSSPTLTGQSSPVRMNGPLPGGRNSPMNPHPSLQQLSQHQPSPLMDLHHGTPQIPHRTTASPRSDLALLQQQQHRQSQSPHLPMRSPVHQHQMLSNGTG